LINIANILSLRYDPSSKPIAKDNDRERIRNITPKEILQLRQTYTKEYKNIPSSEDLENEIRLHMKLAIERSKPKRIVVALSSGIDSNIVFSLVCKEFPPINIECMTVTFDDTSEAREAGEIAESKGAGFHEIHVENPLKDLPFLLSIIKEPRWNIYQYYFIEKAKSYSNILFTGDGGDELFAGYNFRYKKFLDNMKLSRGPSSWEDKVRTYLDCHERDWVPDQEDMFAGTQIKFTWSSIYEILRKFFDNNLDPLEQVLLADYHGKLKYDFIPANERFFEHFDIMGVAPLLSTQIIDLSMKIPAYLKYEYETNTGKIQLREIIRRNISSYTDVKDRKIGFSMELSKLWLRCGKEIVTSYLDKARIFQDKIINENWYRKSLARIANANNSEDATRYISKMLQLLSLEVWYRLFVTSDINAHSSL
jgi:asparagine synthase (glutamine-hydrolysing)